MTSRADEDNRPISGSDHVNLVRLQLQGQQSWGETSSGGSKDLEGGWTLRPGPPYPWNNIFHSYLSEPSYFTGPLRVFLPPGGLPGCPSLLSCTPPHRPNCLNPFYKAVGPILLWEVICPAKHKSPTPGSRG